MAIPRLLFWPVVWVVQAPMFLAYLLSLLENPAYQLVVPLLAVATLGLLAWRWNRHVELPETLGSRGLLVGGLMISAGAVLASSLWLAGVGFLLTLASFFCSQREFREEHKLSYMAGMLLALLRPPLVVFEQLNHWTTATIRSTTVAALRWLEVPHVAFDEALLLTSHRVYWDDLLVGPLGWPVFVGVALIHSAIWRRSWVVQCGNVALGWGVCLLFHIGTTLVNSNPAGQTMDPRLTTLLSIPVVYLLFLSAERGLRGLLAPIPDGPGDSRQANLIVYAWNWWLHGVRGHSSKGKLSGAGEPAKGAPRWFIPGCFLVAVLVGIVQLPRISSAVGAFQSLAQSPSWSPDTELLAAVWGTRSQAVDYRHLVSPLQRRWGQEAMVWTAFFPNRVTQIGVTLRPDRWFSLPSLYVAQGWSIAEQNKMVQQIEGKRVEASFVVARLSRNNEHGLLCYTGFDPQAGTLVAEPVEGACHMIQSFTRFNRSPTPEVIDTVVAEFTAVMKSLIEPGQPSDASPGE